MLLKFALLLHSYFTYREPVYPVPFLSNQITERGCVCVCVQHCCGAESSVISSYGGKIKKKYNAK